MDFKNTLRKEINDKLHQLKERDKLSDLITENITSMPLWIDCKNIFIYISFRNEVETESLIEKCINSGKRVYAPLINGRTMDFFRIDNLTKDDYIINRFGIPEPPKGLTPHYPEKNDIMIVPGVGFTKNGHRMGRGGGYYDRYLSDYPVYKMAIAFEAQLKESLPTQEWDILMDMVVTENSVYGG